MVVRLVTFNIFHGASRGGRVLTRDALAEAVRLLDPDVLALQEVDYQQPRSGLQDQTAVAAEAMSAIHVRFAAALHGTSSQGWSRAAGEDRDGRPAYGVALLSRLPVAAWSIQHLPLLPTPWLPTSMWAAGSPRWLRDEARVALTAEVGMHSGGPLLITTTHLSTVPGWNVVQVRSIMRQHRSGSGRTVLMGDLNMSSARARRVRGLQPLANAATFPNDAPTQQLDHILGTPDLEPVGPGRAYRFDVSDHCALTVDLLLPA